MSSPVILSIDQGTTNTKALLVDADGTVLVSRSRAMRVYYPRPGWAEQSACDIWDAVFSLIGEVLAAAPALSIGALAISNQRETVVLWDAETGQPIAPAVLWQCRRSADRCAELRVGGCEDEIIARTGLPLDPLFPAAKIAQVLDSVPGARERAAQGQLRCGTIDSWLLWNLTGGAVHATDHSNASRTQLFNIETLEWDSELARLFNVPLGLMPQVAPSDSCFGTVSRVFEKLPDGTPVHAMLGDSHAALFGHGAHGPGRTKATIGTGSSLMTATATRVCSSHGLSSTIAWGREREGVQYALEGNISASGQAAAFATTLLGLADEQELTELAASVANSGGVVFVPALAGLGAPYWSSSARGTITGMSLSTRPAHVARATLEAIALQIGDVLSAIEADLGMSVPELSVDGGAARNPLLVQLIADLLDRRVLRPKVTEASALGVARLASEALGIADYEGGAAHAECFEPSRIADERVAIRRGWAAAVARVIAPASD